MRLVLSALAFAATALPAAPAFADDFSGVWATDWDGSGGYNAGRARMIITRSPTDPTELDGMWDSKGYNALLTGKLTGQSWTGTWMIPGTAAAGTFTFTLKSNSHWEGTWTTGADHAAWRGNRIGTLP